MNYLVGKNLENGNFDILTTPDNTLPSFSNIRRTESYMEAMALNFIVQEIMNDGKLFH